MQRKTTKILLIVPDELLRRIQRRAKKERRNRSAFIRRVLDYYIAEQDELESTFKRERRKTSATRRDSLPSA